MPLLGDSNDLQVTVSTTADTSGLTDAESKIESFQSAADELSTTLEGTSKATKDVDKKTSDLNDTVDEGSKKSGSFIGALGNMKDTLLTIGQYYIGYQLVSQTEQIIGAVLGAAGGLEQTNMSFQSLIGNATQANQLFGQLVQYANVTPFTSSQITDSAKQLLAFGQSAQQTITTVKQLGDVSAAGGGDLQQLSLVTGQIFSQGKLRAQDMYQVINDGGAGLVKIMAANAGGMQKLTDEFNTGGIPAQQYFDAINQATSKGGFAFQGAQKQATTFNGELSTLQDSATQFGLALLGVHTDPNLGLQVEPGGLFDRMKTAIGNISTDLMGWQSAVEKVMPNFLTNVTKVADKIDQYLSPKVMALWNTFTQKFLPAIQDIVDAFGPTIGEGLVWVFGEVIDALNLVMGVLSPVIKFLSDNTWIVWGVVAAFVAFKGALLIDDTVQAFQTSMAIIRGEMVATEGAQGIRLLTNGFTGLSTLIASPMIMPAIAIGAAVAALVIVYNQAQATKQAVEGALNAQVNAADQAGAIKNQETLYSQGKISKSQENNAINALLAGVDAADAQANGHASGGLNISAGWSWVGENGPELAYLPQGSNVYTNTQSKSMAPNMGSKQVTVHQNNTFLTQYDPTVAAQELGFRLARA